MKHLICAFFLCATPVLASTVTVANPATTPLERVYEIHDGQSYEVVFALLYPGAEIG